MTAMDRRLSEAGAEVEFSSVPVAASPLGATLRT